MFLRAFTLRSFAIAVVAALFGATFAEVCVGALVARRVDPTARITVEQRVDVPRGLSPEPPAGLSCELHASPRAEAEVGPHFVACAGASQATPGAGQVRMGINDES